MTETAEDYELFHYGVKGMKWGVRKTPTGATRRTNRDARRDAREYTKAKMFYGDGAGTRRKLIKNKVESKKKRSEDYAKAFDYHVQNTDMSKRVDQARGERKRKDAVESVKKTTRGVKNTLVGNAQYATASAITIAVAGQYAYKNGGDKYVKQAAASTMKAASKGYRHAKGYAFAKKMGL